MLSADLMDVPIEVFGGYCPAVPPVDLPPGAAAVAQDVEFPMGAVRQRGGLFNYFQGSPVPANAAINGLKSYLTPALGKRLMAWDSLGNLYKRNPQGTLALLFSRPYIGLYYRAFTLFGREYQAFFDQNGGADIPRQYDDTNWDRISQTGPGASPSAADSGTAGNIAAGLHQVSVCFITRQNFITQAAPPNSWNAAGSKQCALTNIAVGPPNVVARLILFSPVISPPATTGVLYSLPSGSSALATPTVMLINDNTTTSLTVDFTDAILQSGFNGNYLLSQLELGEVASVMGYNSRLLSLGERNRISNVVNPSFDGGFNGSGVPLGWTQGTNFAGGGAALAAGLPADWGDAFAIEGDGATAIRGQITQSAYQDYLGVPIIARNTDYSVRARVAKTANLAAGTLHINLTSTSGSFTTVGLQVGFAALAQPEVVQEFTAQLTDIALATPPSDLKLQVYVDGTPTANEYFIVDSIEIFPTVVPYNYSTARFSYAFNPEGVNSVTGQVQIRPNDGQQLRASFPIRQNLYLAKDHYLCHVQDDGVNEPSSWSVIEDSSTVGICGPNAVDWTEEWACWAERSGVYVCWGSDPVKISPEIETDASRTGKIAWDSVNWNYGHTVWVRIDQTKKLILIGVPVNGSTVPNVTFTLDYRWLDSAADIAASPLINYSAFTGKILAHGKGRRWALWTTSASSMCMAELADGTSQRFFGNAVGNGKIYEQLDPSLQSSDDGATVSSNYVTYGLPSRMEEQMMQLGNHRKLAGYMKFRAYGAGSLNLAVKTAQRTTTVRSYTLSAAPTGDGERPLNLHGERFFVDIYGSGPTSWWQLELITLCIKKDPTIVVRGVSA